MCQHGCLAGEGAKTVPQDLGDLAILVGDMFLTVEDAQDDIAKTRKGDATPCGLGPFAPTKVNQVEPRPPTHHASLVVH